MSDTYVHGYDPRENERLHDQVGTLVDLLHADTAYPPGSTVLEAGCGVGAQTITLAKRSPDARFTSVDVSADSLAEARRRADRAGLTNVGFRQADIFALPFSAESFDHVFVCFVLEHLSRPVEALAILNGLLRPGGTITVVEGDHGSTYFHPAAPPPTRRSGARSRCRGGRRQRPDRPAALPLDGRGALRRGRRVPPEWCTSTRADPIWSMVSRGRRSPP
jgi:SAM-dependent methyltransferase